MPIFKRPTSPAIVEDNFLGRDRTGRFIRMAYPPAPVRQPRKGSAYVGAAEMLSLPALWSSTRTIAGIVSGLPVLHADTNEPVSKRTGFFAHPCDDITWREMIFGIMVNLVVHGNAFCLITGVDMMGRVNRVMPVTPSQVRVARRPDGSGEGALVYYLNTGEYGPYDLLHFRLFMEGGYDVALSPLISLARHLALMVSEDELALNLFEDGGVPSGYWSTEGNVDEVYIGKLAASISESAMGGRGVGTLVVDRGLEYKVPALSFEELELLKCRQWSASECAQIVGVPPHLVGAPTYDSESYSNVSQDLELFSKISLDTYRDCIVDTFCRHGIEIKMAEADLIKPSELERAQAAQIRIDTGLTTINEERELEARTPLPGGDVPSPVNSMAPGQVTAGSNGQGRVISSRRSVNV